MGWLRRYRLIVVLFTAGTLLGIREYRVTRSGGVSGGPGACEASAASCFSIPASALATQDPAFWSRHAQMVDVVAALNPQDPDTEFLKGMEALAAGDEGEFVRRFEQAIARGVKHNQFLLHFYAQYLLDSGADWQRVNEAVNRWRENHQLSRETLSVGMAAGPSGPADESALRSALARVPWIDGHRLERDTTGGAERWRLHLSFRPGRTVDIREAVAAVTTLAIPPQQRHRFEVTCRTLLDCTANRVR
ncbi:MAG TPA: hypothetical protein VFZ73_17290 [Gemmatimonadaceae bacterium]